MRASSLRSPAAADPSLSAAATCDLYSGEKKVTNVFHYTFAADKPLQRYVLPRTYRQAMQWLDAQRRRKVGIEVRQAYDQAP